MSQYGRDPDRVAKGLEGSGADGSRKFWIAIGLYGVLAALVWFTIGEGRVFVGGREVDLRLLPLLVIGGLALRTLLAHQANKIRCEREQGKSQVPESLQ